MIENPYQNPGSLPPEDPFSKMPEELQIEVNQTMKQLIKEANEFFKEAKQLENNDKFYNAAIKKRIAGEKYLEIRSESSGIQAFYAAIAAFKHAAATFKIFQEPYEIIFSADCLEKAFNLEKESNLKIHHKDLIDLAKLWELAAEQRFSKIEKETILPQSIKLLNEPDKPISCSEKASNFYKKVSLLFENTKNQMVAAKYRELAADLIITDNENTNSFEQAIDLYRQVRTIYSSNYLNDLAGNVYYKEMRLSRLIIGFKSPILGSISLKYLNIKWILKLLYEYICGYGERPRNVIITTLITIISSSFLFMFFGINYNGNIIRRAFSFDINQLSNTLYDWINCLYFSTVTFTTLGYGDYQPYGFSKLFASFEALIGAFLIAVFIFTWARKLQR